MMGLCFAAEPIKCGMKCILPLKPFLLPPMGCCWGRQLKGSLRIHDSSTNINIFILLSSLTAPGRRNHAYSINKRHAQCSQVSVSIHTHPQIPWQKLFVLTRACKRDRTEKQTKTQKGERGVKKKKRRKKTGEERTERKTALLAHG